MSHFDFLTPRRGVIPKPRAFTSGARNLARRFKLPWQSTRDPSLRLKNGFARDDATERQECPREIQPEALPTTSPSLLQSGVEDTLRVFEVGTC